MKLIIDISEEDYKRCTVMASAIRNGIPLDNVKAEIIGISSYKFNVYELKSIVLDVLDNIGKESEVKPNEM